jgi:phage terminase small subunit
VAEYLVDLNATQAAIRAGYAKRTAYSQGQRLLKNVETQEALTDAIARRAERTNIESDWVVAKLVENVVRAMCNRPVLDKDGEPSGEYIYDGQVANAALKLLGEHLLMFPSKYKITQDNRTLNVNGEGGGPALVTLAELRKRAFEERQASAAGSTDATSEAQE